MSWTLDSPRLGQAAMITTVVLAMGWGIFRRVNPSRSVDPAADRRRVLGWWMWAGATVGAATASVLAAWGTEEDVVAVGCVGMTVGLAVGGAVGLVRAAEA